MSTLQQFRSEVENPMLWIVGLGLTIVIATAVVYLIVGDLISVTLAISVSAIVLGLIYTAALEDGITTRKELSSWLLDIRKPKLKSIGIAFTAVLCGLVYRLFVGIAQGIFSPNQESANHTVVSTGPPTGLELLFLVLAVAILGPLVEELVYRGVMQRFLTRFTGPIIGIGATAVTFALLHIPSYGGFGAELVIIVWPISVMFVDSILWGYVYYKTSNVATSFLAHGTSNGIALYVWLFV